MGRQVVFQEPLTLAGDGSQSRRFVYVEEGRSRYRRTAVEVGPELEGTVPVVSGLGDGARIVVEGELLLESAWAEARGQ